MIKFMFIKGPDNVPNKPIWKKGSICQIQEKMVKQ